MPVPRPLPLRIACIVATILSIAVAFMAIAPARAVREPLDAFLIEADDPSAHLVISELLTGAASASDEFIEIFNPTTAPLPLEGLEVVYVTASGATVTRKAGWATGAGSIAPGAHLLLANDAGVYAAVADVTYTGGLAATGGSVALRIQGAAIAIDALGWGSATSWLEPPTAAAPAAGSSLERLPGGAAGSFQDTGSNLVDFVASPAPDPQNTASPPIVAASPSPSPIGTASATPAPTATASGTPAPTATASTSISPSATASVTPTVAPTPTLPPTPIPTSSPAPTMTIADARRLGDGATVTIIGVALSDAAFSEGGGYLADATGGIAVLLSDGSFTRGTTLRVTGQLDTRYEQRTVRASSSGVVELGSGLEPDPLGVGTGSVGEAVEAVLVAVHGEVVSAATSLSTGIAYDLDDGSGPVRVLIGADTGIDTSSWQRGTRLAVIGIVGQRDATGSGSSGYRVQPRAPSDVGVVAPPAPSPTSTPSVTPSATPTPIAASPAVISIRQARASATGKRVRVRGIVTVGNGLVDPTSAVIQDTGAAILVRLSGDAGKLRRGQLVELVGTRSTKSGMLTLRVSDRATQLGTQTEPAVVRTATGGLGEKLEAELVVARGALTAKPRRSTAGNVSFAIDDGSGEVRVVVFESSRISLGNLAAGAWVEVRGALGQDTTGSQPLRGYRIWPRDRSDIHLLASPSAIAATPTSSQDSMSAGDSLPTTIGPRGIDRVATADGASRAAAGRIALTAAARTSDQTGREVNDRGPVSRTADPATASRGQAPLVVLLLALASLVTLAFVAWQNGALGRLRDTISRAGAANDARATDDLEAILEPIDVVMDGPPRLSVVPLPQEPKAR